MLTPKFIFCIARMWSINDILFLLLFLCKFLSFLLKQRLQMNKIKYYTEIKYTKMQEIEKEGKKNR
jgi:hypothetical protein